MTAPDGLEVDNFFFPFARCTGYAAWALGKVGARNRLKAQVRQRASGVVTWRVGGRQIDLLAARVVGLVHLVSVAGHRTRSTLDAGSG